MRPYINNIFSNLKTPKNNGEAWSVDLGRHTLLVGSNTSHKSSILQSVELAIAGSADDIFGRSAVSDAALLLTLAPDDELGITANVVGEQTQTKFTYNVRREDGKVRRPTMDVPGADCLVHRSVKAALSGSPATARKAFLSWCSGEITLDDVLEHLPQDLHSKYSDIAKFRGRGKTVVEALLEVTTYAGKRQREAAKEAKGAEIIMEDLGNNAQPCPSDDDINKMRFAIADAKEVLDKAIRFANAGIGPEELAEQIQAEETKINHFEGQKLALLKETVELTAKLPHLGENVDLAVQIVDVAVDHDLSSCPVCNSNVGIDHLKTCQSFYRNLKVEWEEKTSSTTELIESKMKEVQFLDRQIEDGHFALDKLRNTTVTQADNPGVSVAEAQSRLEAAMLTMSKLEQAKDEWGRLASARDKMMSMQQDVEVYKRLKSSCERAVGKLLENHSSEFSARVQKYLPESWCFMIQLIDGTKEVFRMGIMRDGKLHSALSGAEWTSVVTAIAMAVAEGLDQSHPAVLIPEDRAWDGKTLGNVMRGFANFDGQVIMASTIRPTGRPPKGWTIIDMDEMSAQWVGVERESVKQAPEIVEPVKKTSINHANGGFRVTTRTALILEETGFDPKIIEMMSRETVASIIKDGLLPENVSINDDGTYQVVRSAKVLPMPPAPTM